MRRAITATLIGVAAITMVPAASAVASSIRQHWVPAWLAPPIGYEPRIADALGRPYNNETARQVIRAGIAGDRLRIRFTNELSEDPLTVGAASIARLDASGKVVPGSIVPLTFGGAAAVTIPARAPYLSDPVAMKVAAGEHVAVSVYYPDTAAPPAHAQMLDVAAGNATGDATLGNARHVRASGLASELDVSSASKPRVLVAFGDSITEGAASTPGAAMSYPDQLGKMLARRADGWCWSVVNSGISGNRLLHDGRGPDAVSRFDRDVLAVPGVTHIVLLEGINDIGRIRNPAQAGEAVTAAQIIDTYRQFLARAHARGVKLIIGTIMPFKGAVYDSDVSERKRLVVNAWIRQHAGDFDGLIDFDKAMQQPGDPMVLRHGEEHGDHLHPNDLGYTRMARTALPELLKDRCPAR